MKRFLMIAAALPMLFASCVNGNDDSYKDFEQVQGGIKLYRMAAEQNSMALLPADMTVRLAALIAQAERQQTLLGELPELDDVMINGRNMKDALYGSRRATIVRTPAGYQLTLNESTEMDSYALTGMLIIDCNGAKKLVETTPENPWRVTLEPGCAVHISANGTTHRMEMYANAMELYHVGSGAYRINFTHVGIYDNSSPRSDWSGSFTLTAPAEAYDLVLSNLTSDSRFLFAGGADGNTFYTLGGLSGTHMEYDLMAGVYSGLQIVGGTEEVRAGIPASEEYPASDMRIVWGLNGQYLTYTVYYNGYTWAQ